MNTIQFQLMVLLKSILKNLKNNLKQREKKILFLLKLLDYQIGCMNPLFSILSLISASSNHTLSQRYFQYGKRISDIDDF